MRKTKVLYLDNFLDEPGMRLQLPLGDVLLKRLQEDAKVGLGCLDAREQIRDDTLEQGYVLERYTHWKCQFKEQLIAQNWI